MNTLFANMEEINYETLLDQEQRVERIFDYDLGKLSDLLAKENDTDSYLSSVVYYAFTGRRGLWLYLYGQTFVPFCWHPNLDGQILVFPPRGEKDFAAIVSLVQNLPAPPRGFLLARFKEDDIESLQAQDCSFYQKACAVVEENLLDWKYPVRILSTAHLANAEGGKFRRIRNRVRHIENLVVHMEDLEPKHVPCLRKLAEEWASFKSSEGEDLLDLTDPYLRLLNLVGCKGANLRGLIFRMNRRVQAVTMWEVTGDETANMYVNLCSNELCVGLSDYAIKMTADKLFQEGVSLMNLGGSESAELDYFKMKFDPVSSINIYSLAAHSAVVQESWKIRQAPAQDHRIAV